MYNYTYVLYGSHLPVAVPNAEGLYTLQVLCSKCCSLKSRLEYMDNSEARVCQPCYTTLAKGMWNF